MYSKASTFLDNELTVINKYFKFWSTRLSKRYIIHFNHSKRSFWLNCLVPHQKIYALGWAVPPWYAQKRLHVSYLQAQVSFRRLSAEICVFSYGTIYLAPSQVNLPEPLLQFSVTLEKNLYKLKITENRKSWYFIQLTWLWIASLSFLKFIFYTVSPNSNSSYNYRIVLEKNL